MAGTSPAMTLRDECPPWHLCFVHRLSSVMPGFMPGIHALTTLQQTRRGWPE
jgi:hypothetical protein